MSNQETHFWGHDFRSGETIYDGRGNAYTVERNRAVPHDSSGVRYWLDACMARSFSR